MQTVEVKLPISFKRLSDVLTNALEVASNYWCEIDSFVEPKAMTFRMDDSVIYKHIDFPLNEGGAVILNDKEGEKKVRLDLEGIKKGIQLMAEKSPSHFGDLIAEEDDNTTADVFLQYCVLGDILYA